MKTTASLQRQALLHFSCFSFCPNTKQLPGCPKLEAIWCQPFLLLPLLLHTTSRSGPGHGADYEDDGDWQQGTPFFFCYCCKASGHISSLLQPERQSRTTGWNKCFTVSLVATIEKPGNKRFIHHIVNVNCSAPRRGGLGTVAQFCGLLDRTFARSVLLQCPISERVHTARSHVLPLHMTNVVQLFRKGNKPLRTPKATATPNVKIEEQLAWKFEGHSALLHQTVSISP